MIIVLFLLSSSLLLLFIIVIVIIIILLLSSLLLLLLLLYLLFIIIIIVVVVVVVVVVVIIIIMMIIMIITIIINNVYATMLRSDDVLRCFGSCSYVPASAVAKRFTRDNCLSSRWLWLVQLSVTSPPGVPRHGLVTTQRQDIIRDSLMPVETTLFSKEGTSQKPWRSMRAIFTNSDGLDKFHYSNSWVCVPFCWKEQSLGCPIFFSFMYLIFWSASGCQRTIPHIQPVN